MSSDDPESSKHHAESKPSSDAIDGGSWLQRRTLPEDGTSKEIRRAIDTVERETGVFFPRVANSGLTLAAQLVRNIFIYLPNRSLPGPRDVQLPEIQPTKDYASFCQRCSGLMSKNGLLQAAGGSGYSHTKIDGWDRLQTELAQNQCLLCKYLFAQWRDDGEATWKPNELLIYADFSGNYLNGLEILFRYTHDQQEPDTYRLLRPLNNYIRTIEKPGHTGTKLCAGRPALTDLGGDEAFSAISSLLQECLEKHTSCISTEPSFLPRRLLKIEETDASGLRVKLYEPVPGESAAYVSLSYCWGLVTQAVILTNHSKARLLDGIDAADLANTLKDAIKVTWRLGIHYLWVDSLCILQDDEVAKQDDIYGMSSIYKNATIVLAAASAKGVEEGFLHRKPPGDEICCFPVTLSNESINIHMLPRILYDPTFQAPKHPLDTRAWTMQECALATRMLVFSEFEVFWHCTDAPCRQLAQSHLTIDPGGEFTPGSTFGAHLTLKRLKDAFRQGSEGRWILQWIELVEEYTKRNLSDPGDRLNALQGIADEIANFTGDTYIFGAWTTGFGQCLAWHTYAPPQSRHRLPGVPSWSWASVNQRIVLKDRTGLRFVSFLYRYGPPSGQSLLGTAPPPEDPEAKATAELDEEEPGGPAILSTTHWGSVLLKGYLFSASDGVDFGTYHPDIEEEGIDECTLGLLLGYDKTGAGAIDISFARLVDIGGSNYKRTGLQVLTVTQEELDGVMSQWDLESKVRIFWLVSI